MLNDLVEYVSWLIATSPTNIDLVILGVLCAFTFLMALRELAIDMGA